MFKLLLCALFSFLLLTGCSAPTGETSSHPSESAQSSETAEKLEVSETKESSVQSEAESSENSAEDQKTESSVRPVVDAAEFEGLGSSELTFAQYDPDEAPSYEEYFSTERYLDKLEMNALGIYRDNTIGKMSDMGGFQYVKGWEDVLSEDEFTPYPWREPCDNLYLLNVRKGERLLLVELEGIRQLYVFLDCLYLTTDNAVWRCGRLGENLTCVYEHPSRIYACDENASAECFYFVAEGDLWTQNHDEEKPSWANTFPESETALYRLYLPTGQADKICVMEDLPEYDTELGVVYGYKPITNFAFATQVGDVYYAYSALTGEMKQIARIEGYGATFNWEGWVHKYYKLNQ